MVCRSVTLMSPAKTAELIKMPFELRNCVGRRNHVLDGGSDPPCEGVILRPHGKAHWRHLANTIELSVCGGNAALCQITLTACYHYYRHYPHHHDY